MARVLAGALPDAVAALVLLGCPYQRFNPVWGAVAEGFLDRVRAGEEQMINQHHLDLENKLLSWDPVVLAEYRTLVGNHYPSMPAGVFLDLELCQFSVHVPHLTAATLLLVGQQETVVDHEDAWRCLHDLGASTKELLFIGNAAHLSFLERIAPRRLNQAVADRFACLRD